MFEWTEWRVLNDKKKSKGNSDDYIIFEKKIENGKVSLNQTEKIMIKP